MDRGLPAQILDDDGDALADADAHGRQPVATPRPGQVVHQRGDDPGAGTAERVPDGDGPAERVHQRRVQIGPLGQAGQRLGGERLVQLDGGQANATVIERLG